MTRKLVLKRETLTDLSDPELGRVAGGTIDVPHTVPCLNTRLCPVTALVSALMECPTNPCPTNRGCPQLTAPNCTSTCTTV